MRDHDRRTARHQAAQRLDHPAGGHRVQAGGRFVQDQYRCVTQDGAGDGQTLELAAGQPGRVGVDPGVVAVGETDDEVVCVGRPCRLHDRLVAGAGAAAGDVGADRVVQDEGLLREQGHVLAQAGQREVTQGHAVQEQLSRVRVVEAEQELGDRGLSCAAGAGDDHQFTGADGEGQVFEGGPVGAGVAEGDAPHLDRAVRAAGPGAVPGVGDRGPHVQDLDQPLGARRGRGDREPELGQAPHGRVEVAEERGEGEELAERHPAGGDLPGADADHGEHTDRLDDLDELLVGLVQPGGADRGTEPGVRLLAQPPALGVPAVVRLGEHDVAEGLLDDGGDRAVGDPALAGHVLDGAGEATRGQPEQGCEDEGGGGQVPAQPERGGRIEEGGEGGRRGAHQTGDDHRLDRLDVAGQAGEQIALAVALEEVRGQLLDVVEDVLAQPHHEPLGHPRGQGVARVRDQCADHGDAQPLDGRSPERAERTLLQGVVGQVAEEQDGLGLGERGDHRAHPDEEQQATQSSGQRPETAERGAGRNARSVVRECAVLVIHHEFPSESPPNPVRMPSGSAFGSLPDQLPELPGRTCKGADGAPSAPFPSALDQWPWPGSGLGSGFGACFLGFGFGGGGSCFDLGLGGSGASFLKLIPTPVFS